MIIDIRQYLEPPRPVRLQVGYDSHGGTFITRVWHADDAARCQLCPECRASEEINGIRVCSIMIPHHVAGKDAAAFKFPSDGRLVPRTEMN